MHQLDPVFVFVSKCKNTYVVYRYYVERKQSRCERSWMNDAGSISSAPVGLTDLWILRCTRNALCIAYAKCNSRGINRGRCIRRHTERHCQNSNSNNSNDGLSVMAAWTCSAHGTCVPCSEKKNRPFTVRISTDAAIGHCALTVLMIATTNAHDENDYPWWREHSTRIGDHSSWACSEHVVCGRHITTDGMAHAARTHTP